MLEVERDLPGQVFVGAGSRPAACRSGAETRASGAIVSANRNRVAEEQLLEDREIALEVEHAHPACDRHLRAGEASSKRRSRPRPRPTPVSSPTAGAPGSSICFGSSRRRATSETRAALSWRRSAISGRRSSTSTARRGRYEPRPRRRTLVVLAALLAVASTLGIASGAEGGRRQEAEAAMEDAPEKATRRSPVAAPARRRQRRAQDRQGRTDHPRRGHSGRRLRRGGGGSLRRRRTVGRRDGSCASTSASATRCKKGQILGEIESVEAGQARGEYIAAKAALAAAEANCVRERGARRAADLVEPRAGGRRRAGGLAAREDARGAGAPARDRLRSPRGPRAGAGRLGRRAHPVAGADRRDRHQADRHARSVRRAIDGRLHDRESRPPLGACSTSTRRISPACIPASGSTCAPTQPPARSSRRASPTSIPSSTRRPAPPTSGSSSRTRRAQVPAQPARHRAHHRRQRARGSSPC